MVTKRQKNWYSMPAVYNFSVSETSVFQHCSFGDYLSQCFCFFQQNTVNKMAYYSSFIDAYLRMMMFLESWDSLHENDALSIALFSALDTNGQGLLPDVLCKFMNNSIYGNDNSFLQVKRDSDNKGIPLYYLIS